MKTLLTIVLFLFSIPAHAHRLDTIPGRLIKRIATPAQFVSFDKKHNDRFFARDQSSGLLLNAVMTVPETDCFLANHAKDDLQISYEIREVMDSTAKTERQNYALRIVSMKTGDDTRTWAAKESQDSAMMRDHHEQLKRERKEEGLN
jgi:hypothetical protein